MLICGVSLEEVYLINLHASDGNGEGACFRKVPGSFRNESCNESQQNHSIICHFLPVWLITIVQAW